MKKSVADSHVLNDDDIRALLDARAPTVSPADLDQVILSAAAEQATPAQRTEHVSELNNDNRKAASRSVSRRFSYVSRFIAAACVALLAFTLIPLMQSSRHLPTTPPSPSLSTELPHDLSSSAGKLEVTTSQRRTSKPDTSETDVADTENVSAADETAMQVVEEEAVDITAELESHVDSVVTAPLMVEPAVTTPVYQLARKADIAADAANAVVSQFSESSDRDISIAQIRESFPQFPYRRTKASWLKEIERLKKESHEDEATAELKLFEQVYPPGQ